MLKKCPFCGSEVHWCQCYSEEEKKEYAPNHKGCHRIVCDTCNLSVDFDNLDIKAAETLEECRNQMTVAWNKRAIP